MNTKMLIIIEGIIIFLGLYFQRFINFASIDIYLYLIMIILLFKYTKDMKSNKNVVIFSLIFALFLSIGTLGLVKISLYGIVKIILSFCFYFLIFRRVLLLIKNKISYLNIQSKNKKISAVKFILVSTLIGFLFFLPYFLKFYPGIITWDSFWQIMQARGETRYSDHHPWIHTLTIKLFYEIGYFFTNSRYGGVAFYTLFQMILVAFAFSYSIFILYKNNVKKWILVALWLFVFLLPFNAYYSITIWKDVVFSCIVLIFAMFLWDKYHNKYDWTLFNKIVFVGLSTLICLFRTNGLFSYMLFLLVLFIVYRKEFFKLKYCLLIVISIVFVVKIPIMSIFNIAKVDFIESLSISSQQIAYVIKQDGKISDSDYKELEKMMDVDDIRSQKHNEFHYHISDPVKCNMRKFNYSNHYLDNNKLSYFKIWVKIGWLWRV